MMDIVHVEMLGFVAGATNLFSSIPQLVANFRNPALAKTQSISRNCFQCAGNALWMSYGVSVTSTSIASFAALGCLMAGGLILQNMQLNSEKGAPKGAPLQAA